MQTVILAGGLGTRLKEETTVRPKPMIEVGGKPILWHIMKTYHSFGHNDFLLLLGYKGSIIKEYFLNYVYHNNEIEVDLKTNQATILGSNGAEEWRIKMIDTGIETMTGGRIKRAKAYLNDEFFLTYGDGVCDVDINALYNFHVKQGTIATVTAVNPPARFGSLKLDGNLVNAFSEKPVEGEGKINGGYFVMKKEILDYIPGDSTLLERDPLEKLASERQLTAYIHNGYWRCVDTVRDLEQLNWDLETGHAPWIRW